VRRIAAPLVLALTVLAVAVFARSVAGIEREARLYVDEVVPLIAASWTPSTLVERASPELLELAPAEKIGRLFAAFSGRLGPMTQYRGATVQHVVSSLAGPERVSRVRYLAAVAFEKSTATIQVEVIKRGGAWRVHGLLVNSEALLF
jgi:hypothetical protein